MSFPSSRRGFSIAGVLCGLFLLTGALRADVDTTWTVENGSLPAHSGKLGAILTGSFTIDNTTDSIVEINLEINDYILTPPEPPYQVPFTNLEFVVGDSNYLFASSGGPCGVNCQIVLNFVTPLTAAGGKVGIDNSSGGYETLWWGGPSTPLLFSDAYVVSPEPSIPLLTFLAGMGVAGLALARRRRRAATNAG
jgi:hypothetical protein